MDYVCINLCCKISNKQYLKVLCITYTLHILLYITYIYIKRLINYRLWIIIIIYMFNISNKHYINFLKFIAILLRKSWEKSADSIFTHSHAPAATQRQKMGHKKLSSSQKNIPTPIFFIIKINTRIRNLLYIKCNKNT